jgi:hypothetical protein
LKGKSSNDELGINFVKLQVGFTGKQFARQNHDFVILGLQGNQEVYVYDE